MLSKIVDESLRIWMWQGMNRKGSKLLLVICTSSTISSGIDTALMQPAKISPDLCCQLVDMLILHVKGIMTISSSS
jgi:hypothetical protein